MTNLRERALEAARAAEEVKTKEAQERAAKQHENERERLIDIAQTLGIPDSEISIDWQHEGAPLLNVDGVSLVRLGTWYEDQFSVVFPPCATCGAGIRSRSFRLHYAGSAGSRSGEFNLKSIGDHLDHPEHTCLEPNPAGPPVKKVVTYPANSIEVQLLEVLEDFIESSILAREGN
ncbi:MAG: hypothetical protein A2Z40_04290 [Deltaproteobacteria bacterium RBG_19FT_COMBO_60_16]|nr:MAG: hypothetical protein A2Z40_04290 [Deltaproteobacteria bacterium RBG_19FT_COMBO_60_16]